MKDINDKKTRNEGQRNGTIRKKKKATTVHVTKNVIMLENSDVPEKSTNDECDVVESKCSEVQENVLDMFKSARSLLKKPLNYSNLTEVHSRCKMIMEKLEDTMGTLHVANSAENLLEASNVHHAVDNLTSNGNCSDDKCQVKTKKQKLQSKSHPASISSDDSHPKSPAKRKKKVKPKTIESVSLENQSGTVEKISVVIEPSANGSASVSTKGVVINERSCESLLDISPLTSSHIWELQQMKRMLEDPFLSNSRKQNLNNRILEINNNIIKELLKQAEKSDRTEIAVFQKLCDMSLDPSYPTTQRQQLECMVSAMKEKIFSSVLRDASEPGAHYSKTVDRLNALIMVPHITDSEKAQFVRKLTELRSKMANGLIKQSHSSIGKEDDALVLLEKIRSVLHDPFLPDDNKAKLIQKVNFMRYKTIKKLTNQSIEVTEDNEDLLNKLKSLLQDPFLPYGRRLQVVEKIRLCEGKAASLLRRSRQQIKDALVAGSISDCLEFQGTNLDSIKGYGVQEPQCVRCIHIWNPIVS